MAWLKGQTVWDRINRGDGGGGHAEVLTTSSAVKSMKPGKIRKSLEDKNAAHTVRVPHQRQRCSRSILKFTLNILCDGWTRYECRV